MKITGEGNNNHTPQQDNGSRLPRRHHAMRFLCSATKYLTSLLLGFDIPLL
jgi:hypothetical protein